MSSSAAAVSRTAQADNEFTSFGNAAVAAVVVNAYSSLAVVAKPSDLSLAVAATAMETNAFNANSNNKEEAVIMRSNFFKAERGEISRKETMKMLTSRMMGRKMPWRRQSRMSLPPPVYLKTSLRERIRRTLTLTALTTLTTTKRSDE